MLQICTSRASRMARLALSISVGFSLFALPLSAHAIIWNGTDPSFSAVNANGLTDNYGQFSNSARIYTVGYNGWAGSTTYLKDGWFLTARHVLTTDTGNYNVLPSDPSRVTARIYVPGGEQIYYGDQIVEFGLDDVALLHVSNWNSGVLANVPGVDKRQFGGPDNGLAQIAGFGRDGVLGGNIGYSQQFHRAFIVPIPDAGNAPHLYNNTDQAQNARLVTNGYFLGVQGPGDSGGAMWGANLGHDQSLDLYDWSLIGVTQTGGGDTLGPPVGQGAGGGYGLLQTYAPTIRSIVYPHAVLNWNSNPTAGSTAVDGSGTWNLINASFTDGTNFAFNGPERTEQVIFGSGNGVAGTVTLGATIPVSDISFNAAGSGNYTIAGSGGNSLSIRPSSRITTNVDATISSNITGGGAGALQGFNSFPSFAKLTKNGNATLTLTGNTTLDGGVAFYARAGATVINSNAVFSSGFYTSIGVYEDENATLSLQGNSIFNGTNQDFNLADLGGTGVVNVQDSAALNVGQLYVGKGWTRTVNNGTQPYSAPGTGTFNQSGGTVTASNFVSLGTLNSGSVGTYNLNGGSLLTGSIRSGTGQSYFNFNGGLLTANASSAMFMEGHTQATINTGGAHIDTNGNNITITQSLTHAGGGTDGGLMKLGGGSLTLNGNNTYNGPTTVASGGLVVNGMTGYGATTINPGASLSGAGTVRGNLTMESGSTLRIGGQSVPFQSLLSVDNGGFETGGGDNLDNVSGWFDPSDGTFWHGTWQSNNGAITPNGSNIVVLGSYEGGGFQSSPSADAAIGNYLYQSIGFASGETSLEVGFDWGAPDDDPGGRTLGLTVGVYAYNGVGAFSPNDNTDIHNADGVTLLDSTSFSLGSSGVDGQINAALSTLDISGAGSAELFLRFNNYRPAGTESWPILDNIQVTGVGDSPNPNPNLFTVLGDLDLAADSTISFDITSPGINDMMDIAGSFTAGGDLEVLLDNSVPALASGATFDLFDFASASGSFNAYSLPTLSSGLVWNVTNLLTTGELSVITDVDLDDDGFVTGNDYLLIQQTNPALLADWQILYGSQVAAGTNPIASAVPEPTALVLLVSAACCLTQRRRLSNKL